MAILEVKNLKIRYSRSGPEILKGISLSVAPGDFFAIIGPSGAGKSTLIRLIAGLLQPSDGNLRVHDRKAGKDQRPRLGQIGVVFQQPEDQLFAATVFDEVAYGARNIGLSGKGLNERIKWALQAVGLDIRQVGHRSPFHLGGGEKRLTAIASVMAMKPSFLLLDEPTVNLDARGRQDSGA